MRPKSKVYNVVDGVWLRKTNDCHYNIMGGYADGPKVLATVFSESNAWAVWRLLAQVYGCKTSPFDDRDYRKIRINESNRIFRSQVAKQEKARQLQQEQYALIAGKPAVRIPSSGL